MRLASTQTLRPSLSPSIPTANPADRPGLRQLVAYCPMPAQQCERHVVAGYGDLPSDVPESTRQAIKLLAGHYFENREAVPVATYHHRAAAGRWIAVGGRK